MEGFKNNKEGITIDILRRSKDDAENAATWDLVIDKLKKEGVSTLLRIDVMNTLLTLIPQNRIGVFPKDIPGGKTAEEWKKAFNERKAKEGFQEVDVGPAFSSLWGSKDEEEQVSQGSCPTLLIDNTAITHEDVPISFFSVCRKSCERRHDCLQESCQNSLSTKCLPF